MLKIGRDHGGDGSSFTRIGVGRSKLQHQQQQQQQQGERRPQPGQRQLRQDVASSLVSGGKRPLDTVLPVVSMAGPDTARPSASDVT